MEIDFIDLLIFRWSKVNREPISVQRKTFDDLIEGTDYDFRVCAVNAAGNGKFSDTCGGFTAKNPFTVPGKPGIPQVGFT